MKKTHKRPTKDSVTLLAESLNEEATRQQMMLEANETPCERVRRLAREQIEADKVKRIEKDRAFVANICGDVPFTGPDKDGYYEICGYRWSTWSDVDKIHSWVEYKGVMSRSVAAWDQVSLGSAFAILDERQATLKARYPDTWWGNLKAWWARGKIMDGGTVIPR